MLSANLNFIEKIKEIAEAKQIQLSQLAIAWILRRAEVCAVIVGSRKPSQIDESIKGADIILSKEEIHEIADYLEIYEKEIER